FNRGTDQSLAEGLHAFGISKIHKDLPTVGRKFPKLNPEPARKKYRESLRRPLQILPETFLRVLLRPAFCIEILIGDTLPIPDPPAVRRRVGIKTPVLRQ